MIERIAREDVDYAESVICLRGLDAPNRAMLGMGNHQWKEQSKDCNSYSMDHENRLACDGRVPGQRLDMLTADDKRLDAELANGCENDSGLNRDSKQ